MIGLADDTEVIELYKCNFIKVLSCKYINNKKYLKYLRICIFFIDVEETNIRDDDLSLNNFERIELLHLGNLFNI